MTIQDAFNTMPDHTYVKAVIDAHPVWQLAFRLSEVHNDNAPIGWSRYISLASWLLEHFDLTPKGESGAADPQANPAGKPNENDHVA